MGRRFLQFAAESNLKRVLLEQVPRVGRLEIAGDRKLLTILGRTEEMVDIDWSAQTILPIEFRGEELVLEARAYQGKDEATQAMADDLFAVVLSGAVKIR